MHIPDGFLSPGVWSGLWVVSIAILGFCLRKVKAVLQDKMIPLMGVAAAFIFAVQMLNFPVAGATSGHLLGGVLAAILLGPYGGAIVIAIVLIIQCLIFQDGGLTALGANIFNMSFIGAMGGYLVYHTIRRAVKGDRGILVGASFAAWFSVVATSSICAVELALSGTSPLKIALPAMAGIHVLIGIGETIITVFVIGTVLKMRPDLIYKK
ncbi:MAG: energy-coupling factor ABC transporter permease [Candidatus Omnitrophica bacterium]|nr:energy-coupling factor ABC transporter permease [Candidatus Omnitrophota bacterium]